ncbi:hypothetical protein D043_5273, partial [Vibrio parahaemolyticus EKP-021]
YSVLSVSVILRLESLLA